MKRWIARTLIFLCCAAALLVLANFFRSGERILHTSYGHPKFYLDIAINNRRIAFEYSAYDGTPYGLHFRIGHEIIDRSMPGLYPNQRWFDGPGLHGKFLGFLLYFGEGDNPNYQCLSFPLWYFLPILAILPLIRLFFWIKRRRKSLAIGSCKKCGYDLRAHTPGTNCPECGTLISSPAKLPLV